MAEVETVVVVHPSGTGIMIINKEDFDPKIHTLTTLPVAEPVAEPAPAPKPVGRPRKPVVITT